MLLISSIVPQQMRLALTMVEAAPPRSLAHGGLYVCLFWLYYVVTSGMVTLPAGTLSGTVSVEQCLADTSLDPTVGVDPG